MGAKELLEQQRREEQAKLAGATPSATPGSNSEVENINADTARIIAETARSKAQWELNAQQAGFQTVESYKTALAQLSQDRATFENMVVKWDADKTALQADYDSKLAKLRAIQADFQDREKKLSDREKSCTARESVLDEAQQATKQALDRHNSEKETLSRNFIFIRNRLVRLTREFWQVGDSYGDVLARNIQILDKQVGANQSNLNGQHETVLSTLRVLVNDSYEATVRLMALKKAPDTSQMVNAFDELSRNESFKLVAPARWVYD